MEEDKSGDVLEASLPEELIVKCLSFLHPRDLAVVSSVSRTYRRITGEDALWRELYSKKWDEEEANPSEGLSWKQLYQLRSVKWKELVPLFNENPLEALKRLEVEFPSVATPEGLAVFFKTTQGLDPQSVSVILTSKEMMDKGVMQAFANTFDFTGKEVDIAFREFLQYISIPGSASRLGTIITIFSNRYFEHNPESLYKSADAVFIMMSSLMMLNTDLHSDRIKVKMSKDSFINGVSLIPELKDIPKEVFSTIYDRIRDSRFEDALIASVLNRINPPPSGWTRIKAKLASMLE